MGCGASAPKSVLDATDEEKKKIFTRLLTKEANPLALALNKHFRNLITECEYRSHGDTEGYERMRENRSEHITVNKSSEQAKKQGIGKTPLTLVGARDIVEIFLGYAMLTLASEKKWDGSFNYQFHRQDESGTGETIVFVDEGDGIIKGGNNKEKVCLVLKGNITYFSHDGVQTYLCDSDVEFEFFVCES